MTPRVTFTSQARGSERRMTPVEMLRETMRFQIELVGRTLVYDTEQSKDPVKFVERLLEMRRHFQDVIRESFSNDREFIKAMKEAFEHFVNVDHRCAQFLALYVDSGLRANFKNLSADDIEERLDDVIILFRFLRDKDVFETFYKQYLQKRLLAARSVSDDAERSMIAKLKSECGYQFTSKLEGMFNDLKSSKEQMLLFRRERGAGAGVSGGAVVDGIELDVVVLTTVHWPLASEEACVIPRPVDSAADTFRTWYLNKHSGRRLAWYTSEGTADVRMLFTDKRYELVVSTYQMVILLLFNETDRGEISVGQLLDRSRIPSEELKRHLISLTTPVARVLLRKKSDDRRILDDSMFAINSRYTCPKLKNRVRSTSAARNREPEPRTPNAPAHAPV